MMDEKLILKFADGCIKNSLDGRDRQYNREYLGIGSAPIKIDWVNGYDIRRDVIGANIIKRNQMQAYCCVGAGGSYQVWVFQVVELMRVTGKTYQQILADPELSKELDQISFKAIYSQISLGFGYGASIRDLGKLICNWGSITERDCPSVNANGITDETWVYDKTWKTKELDNKAKKLLGKEFRFITAGEDMDIFAKAIQDNMGVIGGVNGLNNGTWLTERPAPPTVNDYITQAWKIWGHCLWFGAFGQDQFGKFVATPNSWGDFLPSDWTPDKPAGYGWQKFYQSYFDRVQLESGYATHMFNPMTYTDLSNNNNNMIETIKAKGKPEIYAVANDGKTLHWIGGWSSYQTLLQKGWALPFKEVDNLNGYIMGNGILGLLN